MGKTTSGLKVLFTRRIQYQLIIQVEDSQVYPLACPGRHPSRSSRLRIRNQTLHAPLQPARTPVRNNSMACLRLIEWSSGSWLLAFAAPRVCAFTDEVVKFGPAKELTTVSEVARHAATAIVNVSNGFIVKPLFLQPETCNQ